MMQFTGDSCIVPDTQYVAAMQGLHEVGYENIITGFQTIRVPNGSIGSGNSQQTTTPQKNVAHVINDVMAESLGNMLNSVPGDIETYLALPFLNPQFSNDNGCIYSNIHKQQKVWNQIRNIKAVTLRCNHCNTVFNKSKISSARCHMCGGAYNLKAAKEYYAMATSRVIDSVNIYDSAIVDDPKCRCAIVKIKDVIIEYNETRGFKPITIEP